MDIAGRIDCATIFIHFEVNMGAGGTARTAHAGNLLAFFDGAAKPDEIFIVVCIAGDIAITVVDFNHFAITAAITRPGNDARGDSNHF